MQVFSEGEAIAQGATYQLFEPQRHTKNEEEWMQREIDRILLKKDRIAVLVKIGIYITVFVDDKAHKDRELIKEKYNYGITR
jgi:hypothetical protein